MEWDSYFLCLKKLQCSLFVKSRFERNFVKDTLEKFALCIVVSYGGGGIGVENEPPLESAICLVLFTNILLFAKLGLSLCG